MVNEDRIAKAKEWLRKVSQEAANDLSSRLTNVEAKFMPELDGFTEDQSRFKPSESEWSVREVCLHVARWMRSNSEAVIALARNESAADVEEVGSMDDDPGDWNLVVDHVRHAFSVARQSTDSLSGDPGLTSTAPHPLFSQLNCAQWFTFNLMHINVHVNQIKRIKSDTNFPRA
jgi:hypothetical protein